MKQNEINKFLAYINDFYNDNDLLTPKTIYSLLVYYKGERREINKFFDSWINHFKNKRHIEVFNDPSWKYFCQFVNGGGEGSKMIKLYIPLSYSHIEEGAKIIFEFLEKNNIEHASKIGSHLRNDNLVIRVNSMKDAKKIISFVKNNEYLQSGLLETNPFTYNQDGVGLALDGYRSFNDEVSKLLFAFFEERRRYGSKTPPTMNDFLNFVSLELQKTHDKELLIIYKLLYLNMRKSSFNLDDFEDITNDYQGNLELMIEGLMKTKMKYGNKQMMLALTGLLSDDFRYVTNDFNMRNKMMRYLSPVQVKSMINRFCGYNRDEKIKKDTIVASLTKICELENAVSTKHLYALKMAILETNKKYNLDYDSISYILKKFFITGKYNLFTRENNARIILQDAFLDTNNIFETIKKELKLTNEYGLDEVVRIFIERELKEKRENRVI